MVIKYVVVRIDTGGRGNSETFRREFDDVEKAISLHMEKKGDYSESTYWDLVVEYT
jgi:hypothetical protein